MIRLDTLAITGHNNQQLPNRFVRQEEETDHLTILFPGFAYGTDLPLLYYPARLLGDMGAEVLMIDRLYSDVAGFRDLSEPERARMIITDGLAASEAALQQRDYKQITLISKSIGTLTMARLLRLEPRFANADCIWLTPLLKHPKLREMICEKKPRSLFIIGSADEHYDAGYLKEVQEATSGETLLIDGAGHSLEIPGKIIESVQQMERILERVRRFKVGS